LVLTEKKRKEKKRSTMIFVLPNEASYLIT